jgi:GT2 family glycosyltransferase
LGASFNISNYSQRAKAFIKDSALAKTLGLYSPSVGHVSLSGWHTAIPKVHETLYADWISSTAVIYRRAVFSDVIFDEYFESYSYLEDLDLAYTVRRSGRLVIVSDAYYSHFPSTAGRIPTKLFGRYEVRNRLYFVRKHHLSLTRCYICLFIRAAMSCSKGLIHRDCGLLHRAQGNINEIIWQFFVQSKRHMKG